MPHIINTTAVAMSSMNKKPRNLKLPSMQRSDLVLKECGQLVISILQNYYRVSAIVWLS